MGKRRAREIWEYDSMAEFEADGGGRNYGNGFVKIGELGLCYCDGHGVYSAESYNKLLKIQSLISDAAAGINTNVRYFVIGDSTRSNWVGGLTPDANALWDFENMMPIFYYKKFLSILNIGYERAHASSQSAASFFAGGGAGINAKVTLASVLSRITDRGDNVIIEYSMGINDWAGYNRAAFKQTVKSTFDAILAQAPGVHILLVTPVKTAISARNEEYQNVYIQLSQELSIPLVSGYKATDRIHGNSKFYADDTHPNDLGFRRLINFIMRSILPEKYQYMVRLNQISNASINLTPESGYWLTPGGTPGVAATWLRAQVNIPFGAAGYILDTGGNRVDLFCFDSSGVVIGTVISANATTKYFAVPHNAVMLRINITNDATAWTASGYVPRLVPVFEDVSQINLGII